MNFPLVPTDNARPVKLPTVFRGTAALFKGTEDQEFLPAALEILETPPSPKRVLMIWVGCSMLAAALAWSWFAHIDIFAVATGRVQLSGRSKVIQPLDSGKVKRILVENGTKVKAGDLLIELDPTEANAARDAAAGDLEALKAEIARRGVEIAAVVSEAPNDPAIPFPPGIGVGAQKREAGLLGAELAQYRAARDSFRAQLAENVATRTRLVASIQARQRLIAVLQERSNMKQQLVEKNAGPRAAFLDAQQLVEQELTNLVYDKGQLLEADAARGTLERKIEQLAKQFIADQEQKLGDAERKRDHLEEDLLSAQAKADRTRLTAPISGTVQQLAVTTLGQVVTTGQPLLVLVPSEGPIEVEALVLNRDVGFVTVGQEAVVKVDAFPFTRYGTIEGHVVRVSRDAVENKDAAQQGDPTQALRTQNQSALSATPATQDLVFPVTVALDRTSLEADGKEVPLMPGMTTTVEVRTGSRRVIDFLLSPLREGASGAGHER